MAEPYEDFKGYVRGGGRFVQLHFRDLIRLEGRVSRSLVKERNALCGGITNHFHCMFTVLKRKSGSELLWVETSSRRTMTSSNACFIPRIRKDEPKSFDDVVKKFSTDSSVNDLLIWFVVCPHAQSRWGEEQEMNLLSANLSLAKWALEESNGPRPDDFDTWKGKTVVVSGFREDLPEELSDICQRIHWGYPTREEIYKLLTGYTAEYENGEFRHLESTPNRGSIVDDFGCQDERDDYFELMWGSSLLDIVSAARGLDLQDCKVSIVSAIRNKELQSDSDDVHKQVMDTKVQFWTGWPAG